MRVLLVSVLLCLFAGPVVGQSIWPRPYEPNQFAVETILPDEADDRGPLSGALFVTGTASVSENVEFVTELPVARYKPPTGVSGASTSALGNPYVGLGLSSTSFPLLVQVGLRFPVASASKATRIGSEVDMGRTRAFTNQELSFSALVNGRFSTGRITTIRVRTGPIYASYSVPTGSGTERSERDWRFQYDLQLWREADRLITGLTFTGRAVVTVPRSTQHHVALSVMPNWRVVQPGLLVGASLNDLFLRNSLTPFFGLTLSVSYRP